MGTTKNDLANSRVQGRPDLADRVLLPTEAAQLLRVSIHQLYHLTSKKKVPFTKVGGALRFDRVQLLEFIASDESTTDGPATGGRKAGARKGGRRASTANIKGGPGLDGAGFTFNTPRRARVARNK